MALKRLTDITLATGVTLSDLIHIVITGDTSQNGAGSSYKATLQQVYNAFNITTDTDNYVTGGTYSNGILTLNRQNGSTNISGFLSADTYVTGFTFNPITYDLTISQNNGLTPLTQNLSILANDITITGGTYDSNTGIATFYNNNGGSFQVPGFLTGYTDVQVSGLSYNGNTLVLTQTDGTTFSATTPTDIDNYVTGGTYSVGTLTLDRQNGSVVITGFTYTDTFVTGFTYDNYILTIGQNQSQSGLTVTLPQFITGFTDTFVTGFTFNPNTYDLTIFQNGGLYPSLTQNLSILASDITITGGTYNPSNGEATFYNNSGGSFTISGFLTGYTDVQVSGLSYNGNTLVLTQTDGTTFSATTPTFTGNTSATCITDLYVHNLYGCSPITARDIIYYSFDTGWTQNQTVSYISAATGNVLVTKEWVESLAFDDSTAIAVNVATTVAITNCTYNNGTNGVGATLTKNTNGAIGIIDGITIGINDRILVKNQQIVGPLSSGFTNGVYEVTDAGSPSTPFILTRTTDSDETFELDPQIVIPTKGSLAGLRFAQVTPDPIVGVSTLTYNSVGNTTTFVTQSNSTAPQTSGNIPFWTTTPRDLSKGSSSELFWNNTTKRLSVGIGPSPSAKLDVSGKTRTTTLQVTSGATTGYVLTALDSNGNASWQPLTGSGTFTGNTSATCITDLYVNNLNSCSPLNIQPTNTGDVLIGSGGGVNVGIGNGLPTYKLSITGKTYVTEALGVGTAPANQGIILGNTQPIYFGSVSHLIYNSGNSLFVDGQNYLNLNGGQSISFRTNNINSFFVDSNQNIGVNITGSTTDSSKLQIKGVDSLSSNYGLKVQSSGGTNNFSVRNDGFVEGAGFDNDNSFQLGSTSPFISGDNFTIGKYTANTAFYIKGNTSPTITFDPSAYTNKPILTAGNGTLELTTFNTISSTLSSSKIYLSPNNIGINLPTSAATATSTLEVNGNSKTTTLQVTSGATTGYVLTALDSNGNASWQPSTGGGGITADTYVTGFTYSNNNFTISRNQGLPDLITNISTMTGLTINGNLNVNGNTTLSGSGTNVLTIIGSGSSTSSPIFTIQGSSGELFSVTDSLTGSLFSVNNISGLPILEVFSDDTILMGSYLAPSLNTTVRTTANSGTTTIYSIPTSAYTGAFFDYTVNDGTNLRAGNIMSIWSGNTVNYTETSTNDIGNTSPITFNMTVSSGFVLLQTSATTNSWTVKTIIRSI